MKNESVQTILTIPIDLYYLFYTPGPRILKESWTWVEMLIVLKTQKLNWFNKICWLENIFLIWLFKIKMLINPKSIHELRLELRLHVLIAVGWNLWICNLPLPRCRDVALWKNWHRATFSKSLLDELFFFLYIKKKTPVFVSNVNSAGWLW